jgi:hypothetical protein
MKEKQKSFIYSIRQKLIPFFKLQMNLVISKITGPLQNYGFIDWGNGSKLYQQKSRHSFSMSLYSLLHKVVSSTPHHRQIVWKKNKKVSYTVLDKSWSLFSNYRWISLSRRSPDRCKITSYPQFDLRGVGFPDIYWNILCKIQITHYQRIFFICLKKIQ